MFLSCYGSVSGNAIITTIDYNVFYNVCFYRARPRSLLNMQQPASVLPRVDIRLVLNLIPPLFPPICLFCLYPLSVQQPLQSYCSAFN